MTSNAAPVETAKFGFLAKHDWLSSLKSRRWRDCFGNSGRNFDARIATR